MTSKICISDLINESNKKCAKCKINKITNIINANKAFSEIRKIIAKKSPPICNACIYKHSLNCQKGNDCMEDTLVKILEAIERAENT